MKIVLFGDIHFGAHSNSDLFNQECLDFLNFMKQWCDDNLVEDYETIFLGDWYHSRNNINVKTLNYGKEGLITLSNIGIKQYMITGNHDLYKKESREIHSLIIPDEASGIEIVDNPILIGDRLLVPWLVEDEKLKDLIQEHSPKYVFGHFEIPSFKFNKLVVMDGEYNPYDYQGPKMIYSGHFHLRQAKDNITYIGNCFSHDFSDNGCWKEKGFCILETDTGDVQFVEWKQAPKYLMSNLSTFTDNEEYTNCYLRLINDNSLKQDEILKIISELKNTGRYKEIQIIPIELDLSGEEESIELKDIGNMNVIIPEMLSKVDMKGINSHKLIDIYNNLNVI